ncbi:hypothetical protein QO006_001271 [Deinococcus enclensis]|uniref:Uncharacterized protein n=1 Tax=Deinococcus enclensis TaxID=1049582 RepID=A0ABT9MBH1_9DEIO|nr:hypothetical protein [Deinococcus enclensis]
MTKEDTYNGRKIEVYVNAPRGSSLVGGFVSPQYLADLDGKDVSFHVRECTSPAEVVERLSRLIDNGTL